MDYKDKDIGTGVVGPWRLSYFETSGAAGGYLSSAVEISREGHRKARLTIVSPGLAAAEVMRRLSDRAEAWIRDYEGRNGEDTDFSRL